MDGVFIALEGPDGSGKSTIMEKIVEYFKMNHIEFIRTREPGGTKIGEEIRDLLLMKDNQNMAAETEALLYAASRSQHMHEEIMPALDMGKVVLCERFILSSLAYQGIGRGLGVGRIKQINDFAIHGLRPDLTLFFDIDPRRTLIRKVGNGRGDRLEQEGVEFHNRVYDGYRRLLRECTETIEVIDATQDIEGVFNQCIYHIENTLEYKEG